MTANQRRPGFRLPWSPESEEAGEESVATVAAEGAPPPSTPAEVTSGGGEATPEPAAADGEQPSGEVRAQAEGSAQAGNAPEGSEEFMRDLVAAMRGVADEARDAGVSDLRARADEEVRRLEGDAQRRQEDLRQRAEADVAGIGQWASAETERIRTEAEQRVVARRAQLDQQLAADSSRTDGETKAVRDRVAEYERELDAYQSQLGDITDPAAFAAAAKRMPAAPTLTGAAPAPVASPPPAPAPSEAEAPGSDVAPAVDPAEGDEVPEAPSPEPAVAVEAVAADEAPAASPEEPAAAPTTPPPPADEALAARLAALDATASGNGASGAPAGDGEPVTTEVIVKGLGSFGAITGFRQSLSNVDGVDAVALSLGQTGEFVFRATHAAGFDLRGAIVALEGDGATVEDRPEGGLRVTLERAR